MGNSTVGTRRSFRVDFAIPGDLRPAEGLPRSRAAVTAGLLLNGGVQTILLSLTLAVSCVPTGLSSIVSLIRLSMRMVIAMPCTQHVQRAVVFAKTG